MKTLRGIPIQAKYPGWPVRALILEVHPVLRPLDRWLRAEKRAPNWSDARLGHAKLVSIRLVDRVTAASISWKSVGHLRKLPSTVATAIRATIVAMAIRVTIIAPAIVVAAIVAPASIVGGDDATFRSDCGHGARGSRGRSATQPERAEAHYHQ
jgi:hypothetical protein